MTKINNDWLGCFSLDVDECVNSPCPQGSVCVNTGGSFSCQCALGFDLEGGRSCTQGKWSVVHNKTMSRVHKDILVITLRYPYCVCFGFTLQWRHFWALSPSTPQCISEVQVHTSCTERFYSWYATSSCITHLTSPPYNHKTHSQSANAETIIEIENEIGCRW